MRAFQLDDLPDADDEELVVAAAPDVGPAAGPPLDLETLDAMEASLEADLGLLDLGAEDDGGLGLGLRQDIHRVGGLRHPSLRRHVWHFSELTGFCAGSTAGSADVSDSS